MKKIIGLIASQRKLANGEILTKEVANSAGDDCQLELIRLADLKLEQCRGCYVCLVSGKQCPLNDGLYYLVERILRGRCHHHFSTLLCFGACSSNQTVR